MDFVWAGNREEKNRDYIFVWEGDETPDELFLSAADFFRVYINGKFVCYGPERTAEGYARVRTLALSDVEKLEIYVSAYNIPCYACDQQLPYFGAELKKQGKTVANTGDFKCYDYPERRRDVPKFSYQRGFLELYDYRNPIRIEYETYPVPAPRFIGGIGDTADYAALPFKYLSESEGNGFSKMLEVWWKDVPSCQPVEGAFDVEREFYEATKSGYRATDYALAGIRSGFLRLEVEAEEEVTVYATFEEIQPNGKWIFRRSNNNEFVGWVFPKGKFTVFSAEPYTMKFLKILTSGKAKITPALVTYENATPAIVKMEGDSKLIDVMHAAESTFRQNAVDLFTDCPGRERAGWLCDSYFTALTENLLTGKNVIERQFLENIIIAKTDDIIDGMIPECFPAQQVNKDGYIPNWAIWFVLQLEAYQERTGDKSLTALAKDKVFALLDFFSPCENEYGLLEDLRGWIFLEWSICNEKEYVEGVNFPTNMMYAKMLEAVANLYDRADLAKKAKKIRKEIYARSYDGKFFADNAVRVDGKLTRCDTHVSETCQYYALFTGMIEEKAFKEKMITQFGPLRKEGVYPEIGRSNMFIGNYLRFFWLCDEGEYDRVLDECAEYFSGMAEKTGTLWEKDTDDASCNHGFASVASVVLARCLTGYIVTKDGTPVFDENFRAKKNYGIKTVFWTADGKQIVKTC